MLILYNLFQSSCWLTCLEHVQRGTPENSMFKVILANSINLPSPSQCRTVYEQQLIHLQNTQNCSDWISCQFSVWAENDLPYPCQGDQWRQSFHEHLKILTKHLSNWNLLYLH